MKYYVVYNSVNNTFFDVPLKEQKIAQAYCNYLSKRDNSDYEVQERHLLIGIVEYKDKEVMEAINNV